VDPRIDGELLRLILCLLLNFLFGKNRCCGDDVSEVLEISGVLAYGSCNGLEGCLSGGVVGDGDILRNFFDPG